jgi:hypothetical protein
MRPRQSEITVGIEICQDLPTFPSIPTVVIIAIEPKDSVVNAVWVFPNPPLTLLPRLLWFGPLHLMPTDHTRGREDVTRPAAGCCQDLGGN